MAKVHTGNPRTRRSATSTPPARAGSQTPQTNGKTFWVGHPIGLYSLPNATNSAAFMRVEVANLDTNDYELTLELGVLGDPEDTDYPVHITPDFSVDINPALKFDPFAVSTQSSGAMFVIPPQSRVHIALRVTRDRPNTLEFPVAFYEHAGPDRDAPIYGEGPAAVKTLEWIAAPSAAGVTCMVFAPTRFLFWELDGETDHVYFRPWNVDQRVGRFPWSLPLFHHPECVVRVTNGTSFPVQVTPHLIVSREDKDNTPVLPATDVVLANASPLNPGEEREWPCALGLEDRRLPRQEAEQMRLRSIVEVIGPGAVPMDNVKSMQPIKADYQKWLTKIIDWIVLGLSAFCFTVLLVWAVKGLPWPVYPEADVMLQFNDKPKGEFPEGVKNGNRISVTLSRPGDQELPGVYQTSGGTNRYHFKFGRIIAWRRWPFDWHEETKIYQVGITDDSKQYDFTAPKDQMVVIFPAPSEPQIIKNITYPLTSSANHKQNAEEALKEANAVLSTSAQQIGRGIAAKDNLVEASDHLKTAGTEVAQIPGEMPEKQALTQSIAGAQNQLRDLRQKENTLEATSTTREKQHELAVGQIQSDLRNAETAISDGNKAVGAKPPDKAGAQSDARTATNSLKDASAQLSKLQGVPEASTLSTSIQTQQASLQQLQTDILHIPGIPPPPPPKQAAWEKAYSNLLDRQFEAAITVAQSDPTDPKALAISAIASIFAKHPDEEAQNLLNDALAKLGNKQGIDAAFVLTAQGLVNFTADDAAKMINNYDQAIQMDKTLSLPYLLKIRVLIQIQSRSQNRNSAAQIRQTVRSAKHDATSFRKDVQRPLQAKMAEEGYEKELSHAHAPAYEALRSALSE